MKTVTVNLPDDVFDEVAREAKRLHQTVSEVLAVRIGALPSAAEDPARRLHRQDELFSKVRHFSAENQMSRDEVHERGLLR